MAVTSGPAPGPGLKPVRWPHCSPARRIRLGSAALGVAEMAKYLVLSSFTGQLIKRFAAKPPGPGYCRPQPGGIGWRQP